MHNIQGKRHRERERERVREREVHITLQFKEVSVVVSEMQNFTILNAIVF